MGASDSANEQGGIECPDIGTDLIGNGAIVPDMRVRDMGIEPTYEEGVGRIPPQGGLKADGTETAEGARQRLSLPLAGGYDGGGGFAQGGDLRLLPPEHSSEIYFD